MTQFDRFVQYTLLIMILITVLAIASHAKAQENPSKLAILAPIRAVIGEAEGEGYEGMLAVACAIRNRGTLEGVYGKSSKRVVEHLYSQETLRLAEKAWRESKKNDVIRGAKNWGTLEDVIKNCGDIPINKCQFTSKVGNHYFYNYKEIQ